MRKTLLWLVAVASIAIASTAADAGSLPATDLSSPPARITLPIAAAWVYLADDQAYNTIPAAWKTIDFKQVDVLFVGPAGIQADGTFGLYNSPETGDLANRFKWILKTARAANPAIKIIASQWWREDGDDNAHIWGRPLPVLTTDAAIRKYTGSVGTFLRAYLNISGGVDGYDIDYESTNVVGSVGAITSQIRARLHALTAETGRPFYLTLSPSRIDHLQATVASVDFVNMQTYEEGWTLTPRKFTAMGFKPGQLLYGICPESKCKTRNAKDVEAQYTAQQLAGIHVWRLNSDNHSHEGAVQKRIYRFLHP